MLQSSFLKNAAIQATNSFRTQPSKSAKLKKKAEKPASHISEALATSTARMVCQAIPGLLIGRPKNAAEAAKIITKSVYWGLAYNIPPKLLNMVKPKLKNKTLDGMVEDGALAAIAGAGFSALKTALGGPQYTLKSMSDDIFGEVMDAAGGNLAANITSKVFNIQNRAAKTASNILLAGPLSTVFQNPKDLTNFKAHRGTMLARAAVSTNSSYGKPFAKYLDKIFKWNT